MRWLTRVFGGVFTLDLRSLAALRISLGLILVLDTLLRWRDLTAHYTDAGVLPRTELLELAADPWWISLHLAGGGWPFQSFLFFLGALAGLALAFGYQTRAATVLSWILLVSLQSRNPMVLNSGDVLLRVTLFWCIFLPWGANWSVDSRRTLSEETQVRSVGALAYVVQIALLYGFAASSKSGQPWLDGTAVYYALSIDQFRTTLGTFMLGFPSLLEYSTWAVVAFQWMVPILLLCPLATRHTRLIAVVGLMSMHIGIGLSMHIGIFSLVAVAVTVGLLPGYVWSIPFPGSLLRRFQGVLDFCHRRLPAPWKPRHFLPKTRTFQVLLSGLLAYVVMWNFGNVPLKATWIGQLFRLDQHWSMFAPNPMVEDGWYTIEGELINGKRIDLFQASDKLSFEKPESVAWWYPNQRWRKYIMNLYDNRNREHRDLFLRYLSERWNAEHSGPWQVHKARLYYTLEITTPEGTDPPRKVLLREHKVEKKARRGEGLRILFGTGS
jgi:vitamin K-dependent gamma-carboxylase-like protein